METEPEHQLGFFNTGEIDTHSVLKGGIVVDIVQNCKLCIQPAKKQMAKQARAVPDDYQARKTMARAKNLVTPLAGSRRNHIDGFGSTYCYADVFGQLFTTCRFCRTKTEMAVGSG